MFDPLFWQMMLSQPYGFAPPVVYPPHVKQAFQPNPQAAGGGQGGMGGAGGGDPLMDLLGALGGMGGQEGAAGGMGGGGGAGAGEAGGAAPGMERGAEGRGGEAAPPTDQDLSLLDPMSAPPLDMGGPAAGGAKPEGIAQLEAALAIMKEGIKKFEEALETLTAQGPEAGMGTEEAKRASVVRKHLQQFLQRL